MSLTVERIIKGAHNTRYYRVSFGGKEYVDVLRKERVKEVAELVKAYTSPDKPTIREAAEQVGMPYGRAQKYLLWLGFSRSNSYSSLLKHAKKRGNGIVRDSILQAFRDNPDIDPKVLALAHEVTVRTVQRYRAETLRATKAGIRKRRDIFIIKHAGKMTGEDIGKHLGISGRAVRYRINRFIEKGIIPNFKQHELDQKSGRRHAERADAR